MRRFKLILPRPTPLPGSGMTIFAGLLLLAAACATVEERPDWIQAGVTTREEVMARYGPPDLIITSLDGETVVYRPAGPAPPRIEMPTIQPGGPYSLPTTKMQEIPATAEKQPPKPAHELRIRYDARGVVQDVATGGPTGSDSPS